MTFETKCVVCGAQITEASFERQDVCAQFDRWSNEPVACCSRHFFTEAGKAAEYDNSMATFAAAVAARLREHNQGENTLRIIRVDTLKASAPSIRNWHSPERN